MRVKENGPEMLEETRGTCQEFQYLLLTLARQLAEA